VYLPTQLALMNEYAPESRYYSVNSVSVEEGSQQGGNPPHPPHPPPPPNTLSHVVVTVHMATVLMLLICSIK
jgi:hypothetical protein